MGFLLSCDSADYRAVRDPLMPLSDEIEHRVDRKGRVGRSGLLPHMRAPARPHDRDAARRVDTFRQRQRAAGLMCMPDLRYRIRRSKRGAGRMYADARIEQIVVSERGPLLRRERHSIGGEMGAMQRPFEPREITK